MPPQYRVITRRHGFAADVWRDGDAVTNTASYVDVLYGTGYYSCYTLSVDLKRVCDASRQVRVCVRARVYVGTQGRRRGCRKRGKIL